jgi:squalene-hopene/tetraprenyl-beta-curcumene cyclase
MKINTNYFWLLVCFVIFAGQAKATLQVQNYNSPSSTNLVAIEIEKTLTSAQSNLLLNRIDSKYWNFPLYLGSMYTSQYILLRHWLKLSFVNYSLKFHDLPKSPVDEAYFKNYLQKTQMQDGSWQIIYDYNTLRGDLNATILHYAALKAMGAKDSDSILIKAKNFILKNGGIKKSSLFTKIALSLFGNYSWSEIPNIPYILFDENFPMNYKNFGQWIGPHLFPISYLKNVEAKKQLGPNFDLSELWITLPSEIRENNQDNYYSSSKVPRYIDRELLLKIIARQKPNGSFGGYTTATLFSLVALRQYQHFYHDLDKEIEAAIFKGLTFVDSLYFNSGTSSYLGVTCDGRYWDTALIGQGLLETGTSPQIFNESSQYLLGIQDRASGGFGFGLDFEEYMDTDDTAEILLYFKKAGVQNKQTDQAISWLLSMQNRDGGWGAFDRDNTGNFILKFATRDFLDSADMFDESSADVTGHILEALAAYGYTIENSQAVRDAVEYLSMTQDDNLPAWLGRWGNNYIYGSSASLIGLMKAGVSSKTKYVQDSIQWLINCQNKHDGGFGESFDSYSNPERACKGISTPSQTAWALMALIETGNGKTQTAKAAAAYLVNSYQANGNQWIDKDTFVATGHPKIVPMHYPSYAWAFSLMALSRYQNQFTK